MKTDIVVKAGDIYRTVPNTPNAQIWFYRITSVDNGMVHHDVVDYFIGCTKEETFINDIILGNMIKSSEDEITIGLLK
jgi:hypothetical protein